MFPRTAKRYHAAEPRPSVEWRELRILASFRDRDLVVVHVRGKLGLRSAPYLERHLMAYRTARLVILDCAGVTFAAEAGLRVIHTAARVAQLTGRHLILIGGPVVSRSARSTGLCEFVPRASSVGAAISRVVPSPSPARPGSFLIESPGDVGSPVSTSDWI